jgi:hypothetical protein
MLSPETTEEVTIQLLTEEKYLVEELSTPFSELLGILSPQELSRMELLG